MNALKFIGSLTFTIFISVTLILLLVISTSVESLFGTGFIQKTVYQTRWFDFVLALLWINIFTATLLRFPFKKHQTAFLVTHIGILGLLLGALMSRLWGIEGQMMVWEQETSERIQQSGHQLQVTLPNEQNVLLDLASAAEYYLRVPPPVKDGTFICPIPVSGKKHPALLAKPDHADLTLAIQNFSEHLAQELEIQPSPHLGEAQNPNEANPALRLHVKSRKLSMDQTFWLVKDGQKGLVSNEGQAGPFRFVLSEQQEQAAPANPVLRILKKTGEELVKLELTDPLPEEIVLNNPGIKLTHIAFYSHAQVMNQQLINHPDGGRLNPAVSFDLVDKEGRQQHYVHFAFFPEFEAIHSRTPGAEEFAVDVKLDLPAEMSEIEAGDPGPRIVLFFQPDGGLRYRPIHQTGPAGAPALSEIDLQPLVWNTSGWLDMEFRVEEILADADVSAAVRDSESKDAKPGVEVLIREGEHSIRQWILQDKEFVFPSRKGPIHLGLVPNTRPLSFQLTLDDFRKKDYPGTNSPSSFESDVTLHDPNSQLTMKRTISMNKPLDYQGFRIFQSSYIQDPSYGEASVFTVAKNPGIAWIYWSSGGIFCGAFLQFYVKGLSKKANGNGNGNGNRNGKA